MDMTRMRLITGLTLTLFAAGSYPTATAQCWGMSALGRISSVSGHPFQAEVHMTIEGGTDEKVHLQDVKRELISRDSQGRVRIDMQARQFSPSRDQEQTEEHHCVIIFDPVCGKKLFSTRSQRSRKWEVCLPPSYRTIYAVLVKRHCVRFRKKT